MEESDLRALASDNISGFSDSERAALGYARAMSQAAVDVDDAVFSRLRAHFDEPQIVELTAVIAWENYRARFNHALGMESEGFSEAAFCPLPPPKNLPAPSGVRG